MIRRYFDIINELLLPRFTSREEEETFWAVNDERKFDMRQFFMFFGVFAFLAHGILDISAGGSQATYLISLRVLSVFCMLLIAIIFSKNQKSALYRPDTLVIAYLLIPALTIIAMTVIADVGTAADTYPFGLAILFAYGGTVLVPGTRKLTQLCLASFVIFLMTTPFSGISSSALLVNLFFLTVGISAICIGSAVRERLERQQLVQEKSMYELNQDLEMSREEAIVARDEAVNARQTQSNFIASVSHELRTPLNAIIGFSDLMKSEIEGPIQPVSYRGYIQDIHWSGQSLLMIVNDLLDIQRLKVSKMSWTDTRFSINEMVRHSMVVCQSIAEAKNITLKVEQSPMSYDAYGDSFRMSQVITNLITNAMKFSNAGSTVTVTQEMMPSGEYRISVTDEGIGIAEKDLLRIQQPFQQVEEGATLAKEESGLGLGLSIVRGILDYMSSRFEMESKVGKGTSCHVFIPASKIFLEGQDMKSSITEPQLEPSKTACA